MRERRDPIETSVIQARSSEDSKDPHVGKAHERTRRLGVGTNTENVPNSSQTRSIHDSETFNVGDKTLHERTERPVVDHDNLSHEQNNANAERGEHGLQNSRITTFCCEACAKVPAFENWFRKLRTTQIDTLFNKIYDKIRHITHLFQNRRKWFRKWATSNCLNCSRRIPKRSAQHAYHTGTWASSIAHAGISCRKKQWPIENSLNKRWTFFHFQSMLSRREDLMATDMGKSQETKNIIWLTNWRRNAKRKSSKESMTDSYEIMNSVSEWLNTIEMKKFCRRWDVVADEDHTYHLSEERILLLQEQMVAPFPISLVLTPYHWEDVLISNKRCLPWKVYTKKLEKNNTCLLILTSTNNGNWHRVRPLHGGNGKIPGGLLKIHKVKEEASKVLGMNGETRYWHYFGENLRSWLSRIQFIFYR